MKVLLVNPPDVDVSLFDWATAKRGRANNYPAYGLGVLARHLLDNGHEPKILNLNHELLKIVHASDSAIDYDSTWQSILSDIIFKYKQTQVSWLQRNGYLKQLEEFQEF